jgi:hypothetical protein
LPAYPSSEAATNMRWFWTVKPLEPVVAAIQGKAVA